MTEVVIVAAVARNGVIGVDGRLPWHLPEDLARFKRLTSRHALIMGRATFESIGRPLPDRVNIVLTRGDWRRDDVMTASSLEEALEMAASLDVDAMIAGGAAVYEASLPVADRLELTEVDLEPDGDTRFPDVDWSDWVEVSREEHPGLSFVTYERA